MGDTHTQMIAAALVAYPDAKTRGFFAAIRKHVLDDDDDLTIGLMRKVMVVPDAFFLDFENSVVVAIEVEVGCPISAEKMDRYCDLSWLLDEYDWRLAIVQIDQWGKARALDAHLLALQKILKEARGSGAKPDAATLAYVADWRKMRPETFS